MQADRINGHHEDPSQSVDSRVRRWRLVQRMLIAVTVLAGATLIAAAFDPYGDLISPFVWGPCIGVVCGGGMFAAIAGMNAREASFAGAHSTTGTVVEVIEVPASGDYNVSYVFNIEAELPDDTTIRRKLDMRGWPDPFSWVGRQLCFRHNTTDTDDLEDAFFGRDENLATRGEASS